MAVIYLNTGIFRLTIHDSGNDKFAIRRPFFFVVFKYRAFWQINTGKNRSARMTFILHRNQHRFTEPLCGSTTISRLIVNQILVFAICILSTGLYFSPLFTDTHCYQLGSFKLKRNRLCTNGNRFIFFLFHNIT